MSPQQTMPQVELSTVLLRQGDRILTIFNPHWRAFTLPMSKRRSWSVGGELMTETWEEAAGRAAAEVMGRTSHPTLLHEIEQVQQSDRAGVWKNYRIRVYEILVAPDIPLLNGTIAEWLTPDEILDAKRCPLSITLVTVVGELKSSGWL